VASPADAPIATCSRQNRRASGKFTLSRSKQCGTGSISNPFQLVLASRISEHGSPVIPSLAPTFTNTGSVSTFDNLRQRNSKRKLPTCSCPPFRPPYKHYARQQCFIKKRCRFDLIFDRSNNHLSPDLRTYDMQSLAWAAVVKFISQLTRSVNRHLGLHYLPNQRCPS